ncbi:MAG: arginine--tRNA ligase [Vicinamibacterales bacterium]
MILPIHHDMRAAVKAALGRLYDLPEADLPSIVLEVPPNRTLGDLATPVAFELARRLRKAPRAIASELAGALAGAAIPLVSRIDATPSGYLNVCLRRSDVLAARLGPGAVAIDDPAVAKERTIVEHTAINPNKAAHIGHLRNATLGDTLVRLLRYCDVPVEVQNYIDNTGVQVADVVVGFRELERKSLADVREIADTTRFDYYCWDLYAKVTEWYDADRAHLAHRQHALHAIEQGGNDIADMGRFIARRIVRAHLATMARLHVDYDLLTWEGDILQLQFWARAFDILKAEGAVFLQTEGKLAGCWVMTIENDTDAAPTETGADGPDAGDEEKEKVIVRSNGTVTYVGKDIAYQFWKFGLLGRDFHYEPFGTTLSGHTLWSTTATPAASAAVPPAFGRARRAYNVIDTRQSYLQQLLKQALKTMGHVDEAERSTHFAYEMVALSHKTARELGYGDIDKDKPFVEVSGRKGLGVKADDLIDRLIDKALSEVAKRNPEIDAAACRTIAEALAVAAVRYFLIKFSRGKIIAFDIDEALSFEGESGPYVQYAAVRANNIFGKLVERDGLSEEQLVSAWVEAGHPFPAGHEGDELWQLVLDAVRLDEMVVGAVRTLEPSIVAKYAFGLAQGFNAFYHRYPILNEPNRDARLTRGAVTALVRRQLTTALDLMGATVPPRM